MDTLNINLLDYPIDQPESERCQVLVKPRSSSQHICTY